MKTALLSAPAIAISTTVPEEHWWITPVSEIPIPSASILNRRVTCCMLWQSSEEWRRMHRGNTLCWTFLLPNTWKAILTLPRIWSLTTAIHWHFILVPVLPFHTAMQQCFHLRSATSPAAPTVCADGLYVIWGPVLSPAIITSWTSRETSSWMPALNTAHGCSGNSEEPSL